jgi:hypothetical protein
MLDSILETTVIKNEQEFNKPFIKDSIVDLEKIFK